MNNGAIRQSHQSRSVRHSIVILTLLLPLFGLTQSGCEEIINPVNGGRSQVFWITTSADSYISCGRTASCEEGDLTFGKHGFLVVAEGEIAHKRTYLNFRLPNFPDGTTIDYAQIELYHPSQREDGYTDDLTMSIAPLFGTEWNENDLSWNNRPDPGSSVPVGEGTLHVKSFDWSYSTDLSTYIQQAIDSGSDFNGFMINIGPQFGSQVEKGFYSSNYTNRQKDDFDRAPRLLLKVTLPSGSPDPSALVPLGVINSNATVSYRYKSGTSFPTEWEVSEP